MLPKYLIDCIRVIFPFDNKQCNSPSGCWLCVQYADRGSMCPL